MRFEVLQLSWNLMKAVATLGIGLAAAEMSCVLAACQHKHVIETAQSTMAQIVCTPRVSSKIVA
jgi:hypothetical protein